MHSSHLLDDAFARLQGAEREAATSQHNDRPYPTDAQALAGNYKHGWLRLHGLTIKIENARNSVRSGVGADGKRWANRMAATYGEIVGTRGADGDAVDVFIGAFPESPQVWIINQGNRDGAFDEHKVVIGAGAESMARSLYLACYDVGWTGLQSIYPASVAQLKWWLLHGDMSQPFTPTQLPLLDAAQIIMDKTLWNDQAEPIGKPLPQLMYALRGEDREGLLLDSAVLAEFVTDALSEEGASAAPQPLLDALVIPVSRMTLRMDQLQRVMNAAGGALQVADYTIADPIKARGVLQVAVLFALSDGQAITVWFHNPDTTPAKLTPLDELVSWKWMLNKKDITIVVAPERGRELNPREVGRRVMRLANANSAKFAEANKALAEKTAAIAALQEEIPALELRLAEVTGKVADLRAERELAAAAAAAQQADPQAAKRAFVQTAQGYAGIRNDEAALAEWQDVLDAMFQERLIAFRNALRELGWDGLAYQPLMKGDVKLVSHVMHAGARNVVGVTYYGEDNGVALATVVDDLATTPQEQAATFNNAVDEAIAKRAADDAAAELAAADAAAAAQAEKDAAVDAARAQQAELTARMPAIKAALAAGGMVDEMADGRMTKGPVTAFYSAGDISAQLNLALEMQPFSKFLVKTVDTVAQEFRDSLDETPEAFAARVLAAVDALQPASGSAWVSPLVSSEGLRGLAGSRGVSVTSVLTMPYAGGEAVTRASLSLGGVIASMVWMPEASDNSTGDYRIDTPDDAFEAKGSVLSALLDELVEYSKKVTPAPKAKRVTKKEANEAYDTLSFRVNDLAGHTELEFFKAKVTEVLAGPMAAVQTLLDRGWPDTIPPTSLMERAAGYIERWNALQANGLSGDLGRGDAWRYLKDAGLDDAATDAALATPTSSRTADMGSLGGEVDIPSYTLAYLDTAIAAWNAVRLTTPQPEPEVADPAGTDAGEKWTRSTTADRTAWLMRAGYGYDGKLTLSAQSILNKAWADMRQVVKDKLIAAADAPANVGDDDRDNLLFDIGEQIRKADGADEVRAVLLKAKELGRDFVVAALDSLMAYNPPVFTDLFPTGDSMGRVMSIDEAADAVMAGQLTANNNEADPVQTEELMPARDRGLWEREVANIIRDRQGNESRTEANELIAKDGNSDMVDAMFDAGKTAHEAADALLETLAAVEPDPAAVAVAEETVDPQRAADTAYLNSLVDGTGDLLAADTFERLEPMFAKYEADAEMMALLEAAATKYGDAAQDAARKALAA